MVQTAVRTITLNVYRVDDPDTRKFVATGRPATYFDRLPRQLQKLVEQLIEAVNEDDSFVAVLSLNALLFVFCVLILFLPATTLPLSAPRYFLCVLAQQICTKSAGRGVGPVFLHL